MLQVCVPLSGLWAQRKRGGRSRAPATVTFFVLYTLLFTWSSFFWFRCRPLPGARRGRGAGTGAVLAGAALGQAVADRGPAALRDGEGDFADGYDVADRQFPGRFSR